MAWKLSRPLVTIACHEDLTASDLVGRYLLKDNETVWQDGPLSLAVKHGAICYLDEAVEARKDTTVVIHPLTDNRRILPQEKRGLLLESHPDFLIVMSYNPGYQSVMKDLKHSTRQRFLAIDFTYPPSKEEQAIIVEEGQVDENTAERLVKLGEMVRNLRQHGLEEGISTRLLVYAGRLISDGVAPRAACEAAVTRAMTDDLEIQEAITEIIAGIF
jgi:nitric oxide reductase NorQ protein